MGRIADGNFNKIYGKGRDQIDVATQNRLNNPYGNHTTLGVLGATLIPQLLSGIACYAADHDAVGSGRSSRAASNSSKNNNEEITPESLEKEINAKLAEVGCNDINEVNSELQENEAKLPDLDSTVERAKSTLTSLQNGVNEAEQTLSAAASEIETLKQLKADNSPEFDAERYEYLTVILPQQIEIAKKQQIPAAEQALKETETAQKTVKDRITQLLDAKKYIEPREKQLNELRLNDAVNQFKNDESKQIRDLIIKINNETDNEKRVALARELRTAVETYYSKHKEGECPTIDNLPASKCYLSVKNFKPDTTALDEQVRRLGLGFAPRISS